MHPCRYKKSSPSLKSTSGFSLLQLLVMVAVLVVLMVIMIPMFTRSQERSDQLRCLTNLRKIGMAVFAYTHDHDGRLPGPALGGIGARYSKGNLSKPSWLTHYLVPYLGEPVPDSGYAFSEAFTCPATMKKLPKEGSDDYSIRYTYSQVPSSVNGVLNIIEESGRGYPFGYESASSPDSYQRPVRLSEVEKPDKTYAVLDRRDVAEGIDSGHESWRNILFLDGHVRRVELSDFIKFTEIRY